MPEKTKPQEDEKRTKAESDLPEADKDSWSRDQREKSYYYDDAHGYEIYRPDEEDDEEEETDD